MHKLTNTHKPEAPSPGQGFRDNWPVTAEPQLPLTELAYRGLRKAIVRGDFEPGSRLRVEELTRMYEVSSSPVREALNRLSEQGLVRPLENRGFRVAPISVEEVRDIARVRLLVECEALRDSVSHGDDAWESNVVASAHALALVERRLGDEPRALNDDWSERHRAFHLSLYAACTSPILLDLVDVLFDKAERYRRWSAQHRQQPRSKSQEHQALTSIALRRDAERAVETLRNHIARTERMVTSLLG